MFGLGGPEMLIIAVLALLLFGPHKLPELMKGLGEGIREFRRASSEVHQQIENASKDKSAESTITREAP